MKKIILFGCGLVGQKALNCLGTDLVEAFCDNSGLVTEKYGKRYGLQTPDRIALRHSGCGNSHFHPHRIVHYSDYADCHTGYSPRSTAF